ncbi:MAG: RidA family protein [Saprospiraceae bacterium]|nr:RidA family protein [Saprospiraceae bacterium]
MERKNHTTGAPWEDIVGYSRAVQIGNLFEISGTTAVRDGKIVHVNDAYGQTKRIIEIASDVLAKAGMSLNDVIRTRIYVTDISQWEEIGRAHGEAFRNIKPASTMIEVSGLVDPKMLVEVEFTAYKS